ncbi:MAG: hypothetical protein KDD33_13015 [Bdellovibrionales bacterium]|nr:hypothetical protein [Bdellovibrionales bacterium]
MKLILTTLTTLLACSLAFADSNDNDRVCELKNHSQIFANGDIKRLDEKGVSYVEDLLKADCFHGVKVLHILDLDENSSTVVKCIGDGGRIFNAKIPATCYDSN